MGQCAHGKDAQLQSCGSFCMTISRGGPFTCPKAHYFAVDVTALSIPPLQQRQAAVPYTRGPGQGRARQGGG